MFFFLLCIFNTCYNHQRIRRSVIYSVEMKVTDRLAAGQRGGGLEEVDCGRSLSTFDM